MLSRGLHRPRAFFSVTCPLGPTIALRRLHSAFCPSSLRVLRLMKCNRVHAGQVIASYSVSDASSSSSSKLCWTAKPVFGQVKKNAAIFCKPRAIIARPTKRNSSFPHGDQGMIARRTPPKKAERPVEAAPSRLMGNKPEKALLIRSGEAGCLLHPHSVRLANARLSFVISRRPHRNRQVRR
jgi:hypothetical protein